MTIPDNHLESQDSQLHSADPIEAMLPQLVSIRNALYDFNIDELEPLVSKHKPNQYTQGDYLCNLKPNLRRDILSILPTAKEFIRVVDRLYDNYTNSQWVAEHGTQPPAEHHSSTRHDPN